MDVEWRLLDDGITDAYHHFAVEEALARLLDEGHTPPTLRLRRVQPAVFVGVFQNTWAEVDVAYCQVHGIQVVRRANGGGAVYHEMGSFCFSAFFRREWFQQSDEELYRLFAVPAILTCADYGVAAHFQGRNDVITGGRKIYGSAQLAWYKAFVQSGTFLVNIDFEAMEHALTPPALKFTGKSARSIRERVTSLSQEAGRTLDPREVMQRFSRHFTDLLGIRLIPGELTPKEQALAAELLAVKYGTDAWNLGSRTEYQVTVADRTEAGVISLSADILGDVIQKICLHGDILLSHHEALDELEELTAGRSIPQAREILRGVPLEAGISESVDRLFVKLEQEVAGVFSTRDEEKKP